MRAGGGSIDDVDGVGAFDDLPAFPDFGKAGWSSWWDVTGGGGGGGLSFRFLDARDLGLSSSGTSGGGASVDVTGIGSGALVVGGAFPAALGGDGVVGITVSSLSFSGSSRRMACDRHTQKSGRCGSASTDVRWWKTHSGYLSPRGEHASCALDHLTSTHYFVLEQQ